MAHTVSPTVTKIHTPIDLISQITFMLTLNLPICSTQQEVGHVGLFGKHIQCNFMYSSSFHPITTKLGQHDLTTLRMLNCKGIFHISNGLAIVRLQIFGEEGKQEVCYSVFRMRLSGRRGRIQMRVQRMFIGTTNNIQCFHGQSEMDRILCHTNG